MPLLIPFIGGAAIGGVIGFVVGDGVSSFAKASKYAAIGGALFVGYKIWKG